MGIITNERVERLTGGLMTGSLSDSDDSYTYKNQNYYYDFYALPVDSSINPGDTINITLTSDEFDPLLMLLNSEGEVVDYNYSPMDTTSSQLTFDVLSGEPFFLSVETFNPNSTGDYQLEIEMI